MSDIEKQVNEFKDKGNAALGSGESEKAVEYYSEGIKLDPNNYILYSNRSAAYAKMQKYKLALEDANKVIEINPSWPRGYSRKGAALCFLGDYDEAKEAYKVGLEKNPGDESLKTGLRDVENAEQSAQNDTLGAIFGQLFVGDFLTKLRLDPSTSMYLADPSFVTLLNTISQNPRLLGQHMRDGRVSACMRVLMGRGGPAGGAAPKAAAPAKKEEKKPAGDAAKAAAPVKKEEKKPAGAAGGAPAKKEEKKPAGDAAKAAAPVKKEEKKPAGGSSPAAPKGGKAAKK